MQTNTIQHRLLSVADYYCMAENGILKEDEHVELIKGELFDMSPIGSVHAGLVTRLSRLLIKKVKKNEVIAVQNPIHLSEFSAPEPDISVLKARDDDYMQSLPTADEILLLIEVADSSLHYDRSIKLPQYARHQIPEVWLIDVKHKQIEIYQQPFNEGYRLHLRPEAKEIIQPLLVDDVSIDWQALFVH